MNEGTTTVALQNLLERFAAGDSSAKEQLIAQALDRLTQIARRLLRGFGGEARVEMWSVEVFNAAYPRIAKALDDLKPESVPQFMALARLQMHRVLLDRVDALTGRGSTPRVRPQSLSGSLGNERDRPIEIENPRDEEELRILMSDLLESIGQLPDNEAETVWLKLAGHTHVEIGELIGVHKDTVDRYWGKACVKLAKQLAPFLPGMQKGQGGT